MPNVHRVLSIAINLVVRSGRLSKEEVEKRSARQTR